MKDAVKGAIRLILLVIVIVGITFCIYTFIQNDKANDLACQDLGTERYSRRGNDAYCINGSDYYLIDIEYEGWMNHTAKFINIIGG